MKKYLRYLMISFYGLWTFAVWFSVSFLVTAIFVGCAGSPNIKINKNIYVILNGVEEEGDEKIKMSEFPYPIFININYSTSSTTKSDAEISQEGELKIPTP